MKHETSKEYDEIISLLANINQNIDCYAIRDALNNVRHLEMLLLDEISLDLERKKGE
tara:strand:+ start:360 stop:530 length:171 start_codon:yes stop_codon:yes gene_type:complete